ncbi:MAG: peptigoglycan-binding protein LysM [Alicyclobacillus sp. RIFOXYA1_FULL_53_8]|nr:MAG: peptigoglycan-binding protein LysM [Alicyclobacillus sp. RIFOXYA1_FULL_53_8]
MRVLFLENHPMWIHGLPNGFRDLGHQVMISGSLTKDKIPRLISSFRPQLIVTLGWTLEHKPEKRAWIRSAVKRSGIPHVFWATEDPTHTNTFTLPYIRSVMPDFVFTICKSRVPEYRRMGIPADYLDFGYHPRVHRSVRTQPRYNKNIVLVANAYPHILAKYPNHYRLTSLRQLIAPLVQNNIRIDFWGNHWERMKPFLGVEIPRQWIHGHVPYTEANKIYSSAKIVLGLQNHRTQVTQRTYEILGSGGLLLTNDTSEIRRLFTPGKHLLVSNSPLQTVRMVRHYLNQPVKREQIRTAARRAVAQHSYKQRARRMIEILRNNNLLK